MKTSDLEKGRATSRRYRNRRIGEFLKELDLTEGRGTGIPKILRAMKENGSPRPRFRTDDDHSFFMTVLPIHPDAKAVAPNLAGPTGQVAGQITGQVEKVVAHLDGELTRQELQAAVGVASRAHFRAAYLDPALAAGLVEMTQPDKPNSRSQRYRLTTAGRKLRLQTPKRKK